MVLLDERFLRRCYRITKEHLKFGPGIRRTIFERIYVSEFTSVIRKKDIKSGTYVQTSFL